MQPATEGAPSARSMPAMTVSTAGRYLAVSATRSDQGRMPEAEEAFTEALAVAGGMARRRVVAALPHGEWGKRQSPTGTGALATQQLEVAAAPERAEGRAGDPRSGGYRQPPG